jgi:glycosyltransferase involved in cell wall biosynthesis
MSAIASDLVTVIIPAYNAAATIDETLLSVRAQTHATLEILVVDDGSSDGTRAIVERHAAADPRIRLICQTNGGVAAARNRGLAEARGDYVAPIDADDLWAPTKIEKQMAAMREGGPLVGLVYTWQATIDAQGNIVDLRQRNQQQGDVFFVMLRGNLIGSGSAALMRKSAMLEAGGYDASLRARRAQGCEDYKLYLQISRRYHFAVVPEFLTGYRRLPGAMSYDWFQMLRSYDLVAAESACAQPQHVAIIRKGQAYFRHYCWRRALQERQWGSAGALAVELVKCHPLIAIVCFARAGFACANWLGWRAIGLFRPAAPDRATASDSLGFKLSAGTGP